jgi:hypothetical protein
MRRAFFTSFLGCFFVCAAACSNASTPTDGGTDASTTCDDAKCKMGNRCISDGKVVTCRLPCTSNEPSDPGSCPFGFHCVDAQGVANTSTMGESLNFCVKDDLPPSGTAIVPKPMGQWGAHCDATKGFDTNPDCDHDQGFFCYGISPNDGEAFCTIYGCTSDTQCRMGWWCATINSTPNVTTATRTFGPDQVTSLCLPRAWNLSLLSYPAPCKTDLDCPLNQGIKQHCVDPGDGVHAVCAQECSGNKTCPLDAQCYDPGIGTSVCVPRAGTIGPVTDAERGKADLCSPCHSDADCLPDSYCVLARAFLSTSTEHFCTKKSGTPCKVVNNMLQSDCPMMAPMQGAAPSGVSCTTNNSNGLAPRDQCFGLVSFGSMKVPGCWTASR